MIDMFLTGTMKASPSGYDGNKLNWYFKKCSPIAYNENKLGS